MWTKRSWSAQLRKNASHSRWPSVLGGEVFREAGFRTAALWRNGWIAPNFGFSQGFEVYLSPRSERGRQARVQRLDNPNVTLEGDDGDILDSAVEFLRAHGHERFFLYLHMMDVHQYAFSEDDFPGLKS